MKKIAALLLIALLGVHAGCGLGHSCCCYSDCVESPETEVETAPDVESPQSVLMRTTARPSNSLR